MRFCTECGKELKDEAQFCRHCGRPVTIANPMVNKNSAGMTTYQAPPQTTGTELKKPLSKKAKRSLIAAGVALVILFGGYKLGSTLTSKDRLIDHFQKALINHDAKGVASLLSSDDPNAKIDENSVKGLIKYYKENPNKINDLVQDLKVQSKVYDQNAAASKVADLANDFVNQDMLKLEKGNKILFFDHYKLNIQPIYLKVETNYKNTKLYVDGQKVATATSADYEKTVGPFLPGIHKVEADLKTKFVTLKTHKDVDLMNTGNQANVDLTLDGQDVTLDLGQSSDTSTIKGKVLINGKDVGVNPFEQSTFGPVLTDGSMKLAVQAEMPWGKVTTAAIPIKDSEMSVSLLNTSIRNDIMSQIMKYVQEDTQALATDDVSKFTTVTDDWMTTRKEQVDDFASYDQLYKGAFKSMEFDLDSFTTSEEDGVWSVSVDGEGSFNQSVYYRDETPDLEDTTNDSTFTMIYDKKEKKWLVSDVEDTYSIDDSNVKRVSVNKPVEYSPSGAKTASFSANTNDLEDFIKEYFQVSVNSYNNNDFSMAEPYIDPNGPLYQDQKDYTVYLNKKHITEELLNVQNVSVTPVDDKTYDVTSEETFEITYSDGSVKDKTFSSTYRIVINNGKPQIYKQVADKEI